MVLQLVQKAQPARAPSAGQGAAQQGPARNVSPTKVARMTPE
ncbi:hypothetical protein VD0002_g8027 [Verticillium dahliae]|uniref:Uncharacterized protein n=1 Tax=Verticillium dahliae TaxID=27337 RepID=A0AA45ANV2_VERDA|nr:hypothetical protein BJF96_g3227 [Verticillium dahliae]PNH54978.1 hypothetical protein VD0003_g2609 [Verticillium dahliae]PNH59529.1 hypothetical protein VD0002_g8027 [Verticillium dahliae]PNH61061.1 hypothetical protein VD0001_g9765 [Verticillium dahliae]